MRVTITLNQHMLTFGLWDLSPQLSRFTGEHERMGADRMSQAAKIARDRNDQLKYGFEGNRVTRHTGSEYPIFQAPITGMARSQLVSAISSAGGMGLMEAVRQTPEELQKETEIVRSNTNRPFGYHLIPDFAYGTREKLDETANWLLHNTRKPFMTMGYPGVTSGPDKLRFVKPFKEAGAICYLVVDSIEEAMNAEDAGADGLILSGGEAGGGRDPHGLHIFSLIQKVRQRTDLPLVASGGIADGIGMAGAFALGAEGILMGTRFMAANESPLHPNWKQEAVKAEQVYYLAYGRPAGGWLDKNKVVVAARNEFSDRVARGEIEPAGNPYFGDARACFYEGRTDLAMVGAGESVVLFDKVQPVAEIIEQTISEFWAEIDRLANLARVRPEAS